MELIKRTKSTEKQILSIGLSFNFRRNKDKPLLLEFSLLAEE